MMGRVRSTKGVVFVAVMSALGNVLSAFSIMVTPIVPSIPLGPMSFSLAVDLSHITTFIAALFGGSVIGGLTGLIGGSVAAYEFGFSKGNIITGFALPVGKAITGVTAGILMRKFSNLNSSRLMMMTATVSSYLPEAFYTAFIFIFVFPAVMSLPVFLVKIITAQILLKAFFEMVVMGLILSLLIENRSFTEYVRGFFG